MGCLNDEIYPVVHINGQRIYCPSINNGVTPLRGSEIFVGNIPRHIFEDELIPLFSQTAPIYQLRLMMDFSGKTRGFAYVTYLTPEEANEAVSYFNNYEIRKNKQLSVYISLDNCRLFFGNIPRNKSKIEIETELRKVVDGIVKVFLYPEITNPKQNRGFAFVEFKSHAMAAIARRKLIAGHTTLWGSGQFRVDWADPEPIIHPAILTKIKILYLKNVPVDWSSDYFKTYIKKILKDNGITRIYKKDNYGFIHFNTRENAELAFKAFQSVADFLVFNGKLMEAEWARPTFYSKKLRPKNFNCALYKSLPPKLRRTPENDCQSNNSLPSTSSSDIASNEDKIHIEATEKFLEMQFSKITLY